MINLPCLPTSFPHETPAGTVLSVRDVVPGDEDSLYCWSGVALLRPGAGMRSREESFRVWHPSEELEIRSRRMRREGRVAYVDGYPADTRLLGGRGYGASY